MFARSASIFAFSFAIAFAGASLSGQQDKNDDFSSNVKSESDGWISLNAVPESLAVNEKEPLLAEMAEWMLKYYKKRADEKLLKSASATIENAFTTVGGYEKAYDIMKSQSKKTDIIISEIYTLNDNRYESIVKDYNRQAKMDGTNQVKLERNTNWWCGGIRVELREADLGTLEKVMKSSSIRNKIAAFVKREVEAGRPLAWARITGIGQGNGKGYYGVRLSVITGCNLDKAELEYIDFSKLSERKTISYDEAATCTWAFYRVVPK